MQILKPAATYCRLYCIPVFSDCQVTDHNILCVNNCQSTLYAPEFGPRNVLTHDGGKALHISLFVFVEPRDYGPVRIGEALQEEQKMLDEIGLQLTMRHKRQEVEAS